MNLNQKTLILFEQERSSYSFYPPNQSDSFYNIDQSMIDLFCFEDNGIYKFKLTGLNGEINVGDGEFIINDSLYTAMDIKKDAILIINNKLIIDNAEVHIYGTLKMDEHTMFILRNNAKVIFEPDSKFIIKKQCKLLIDESSRIDVYGSMDIYVDLMDTITTMNNLYIDSAAVVKPTDIDLGDREFSLTDYDLYLREKVINMYTQGEYNVTNGRIGYTWKGGSVYTGSQQLELSVLYGSVILGDFKLQVLGKQANEIPNLQIIRSLHVCKDTTLYIAGQYDGFTYLRPELYLGVIIGNVDKPASALVDGTIIVDGDQSLITIDRLSKLTISESGTIYLRNGATMRSTNNEGQTVLYINGTLVIDSIDQIKTFDASNIQFGRNGKVIVLNPASEHTLLFSTPNGKYNTDLYRIFENTIDHIEYHISHNTGIKIDQYYEYYSRDLIDWFGNRRIEQAIYDGILVWEDGAFIELDESIIPWATIDGTLYQATRLFKSFASRDIERIKDVADRLKYAGAGNITFRFISGDVYKDILFDLEGIKISTITNTPASNEYNVTVDNTGNLFMKNRVADVSENDIINSDAKSIKLSSGLNTFDLE